MEPIDPEDPVDSTDPSAPSDPVDPIDPTPSSDPSPSSDGLRVVGYFEEWGIYGRDFRVADVDASKLTHLNYSFFGVDDTGDLFIHDAWAATDKRFTADQQVSRTFSASEWSGFDAAYRDGLVNGGDFSRTTAADGAVTLTGLPVGGKTPMPRPATCVSWICSSSSILISTWALPWGSGPSPVTSAWPSTMPRRRASPTA